MPNSELFPSEYSNLCPGTQVQEVDRVAALEQKLLILRFQYLQGRRRNGQNICELQNSTIQITNTLYPSLGVGRSYIGGGERFGAHGQIDRFTHASEFIAAQSFQLTLPRMRHAGVASAARGYWAGGETGVAATKTNNIEAVVFEGESTASVSATLGTAASYLRGTASQTKGYFGGNFNANSGIIQALTFAGETTATLGAALATVVGGNIATQSATKGYYAGGYSNTQAINALTFSGETTAALSATLSINRIAGAGFQSNIKGYFASGVQFGSGVLSAVRTVDALTFSGETIAIVSTALTSAADGDMDGISALRKGYSLGGYYTSGLAIDGLDFVAETMGPIGAVLTRGGRYPTPVGKP